MPQVLCDVVRYPLRGDEDEDLGILRTNFLQVIDHFVALLKVTADFNDLLNIVVGSELKGSNIDLDEIFQKILR